MITKEQHYALLSQMATVLHKSHCERTSYFEALKSIPLEGVEIGNLVGSDYQWVVAVGPVRAIMKTVGQMIVLNSKYDGPDGVATFEIVRDRRNR